MGKCGSTGHSSSSPGSFALFSLVLGVMFWTGAMTDANGETRPDGGPPMVITGICLLVAGILALFNIIGRFTPLIRCYREGIEFNLVGATSLDGVPMVRGFIASRGRW